MLSIRKVYFSGTRMRYVLVTALVIVGMLVPVLSFVWSSAEAAPAQMKWKTMAHGWNHTCALTYSDKAYCWGENASGALGNNSTVDSSVPVAVDTSGVLAGKTILQITTVNEYSTAGGSTCVLASDNKVYCWGNAESGRLGNGSSVNSLVPVAVDMTGVLAGKTVKSISGGYAFMCVIASDDRPYCWGENGAGQLGNNSTVDSSVPVAVSTAGALAGKTIKKLDSGDPFACVIASDDKMYCWGENSNGQLGNNTLADSLVPTALYMTGVLAGKTILDFDAGGWSGCAVASDKLAYCWGYGQDGTLGNGTTTDSSVPVAVSTTGVLSGKTIKSVRLGTDHACVTATDNRPYCWGTNNSGQLGNGTTTPSNVPVAVSTTGVLSDKLMQYTQAGWMSTCALGFDSYIYCWGENTSGKLGDGTSNNTLAVIQGGVLLVTAPLYIGSSSYRTYKNANSATPGSALAANDTTGTVPVTGGGFRLRTGIKGVPQMTQISSGGDHTCGISDNKAYCWGGNGSGQLGNNSTAMSNVPVAVNVSGVLSGKTIVKISAGEQVTCVLTSDGGVYCWGKNDHGQLGNNSTAGSLVPVAVTMTGVLAGKTVTSLEVTSTLWNTETTHACVIASGQLYCWGGNEHGQLGNNSTTDSLVPTAVSTSGVLAGKTIEKLALGGAHTCVISTEKLAYCWGKNNQGQLGNGTQVAIQSSPTALTMSGVLAGKKINSIAPFDDATICYSTLDGIGACSGINNAYNFGDNGSGGGFSYVPSPITMTGALAGKSILSITAGTFSACALASDGKSYCWGRNYDGNIGDGTSLNIIQVPTAANTSGVLAGRTLDSMSEGKHHVCSLDTEGLVYCWGLGDTGQLGNGASVSQSVPVEAQTFPYIPSMPISTGAHSLKLQYAQRSAATCSAQTTGYADVTASSTIAYNTNAGVTDRTAITTTANDPTPTATTAPQVYVSSNATPFTETTAIPGTHTGLWDFSLKDNNAPSNTTYCMRIVNNDGTTLKRQVAPVSSITTASGELSVGFYSDINAPVPAATFAFNPYTINTTQCGIIAAEFSNTGQHLQVYNSLSSTGWSLSLAATDGPTALWKRADNTKFYDFNDGPDCVVSGDDAYGGTLMTEPATMSIYPQAGMTTTGLTKGSTITHFAQGTVDAITVLSASSAADTGGYWNLEGITLYQQIPPGQALGNYSLGLTATVVAQ